METTYRRFRLLIYFAAFMLVMSLCFVYAEPVPHAATPLLFATSPQHASFLASSTAEPSFDPAALRNTLTPGVSPALLDQLEQAAHPHHGLFHRSHRSVPHFSPATPGTESSGLSTGSVAPAPPAEVLQTR